MPWKNGYYYRNRRIRNRVVSEYVGAGEYAELCAELDALDRKQRAQERQEARQEREALRAPAELDAYALAVRTALHATLQMLGFHQHKRQWRMRRMTELARDDQERRVCELLNKKTLTAEERDRLRRTLNEFPMIAQVIGDMAERARAAVMGAFKDKPALRIAVEARCEHLAQQLGYEESSTLERMLINEVVFCWFDLCRLEMVYGQNNADQFSMDAMDRWDRVLLSKQVRYLRAAESLARVRRLLKLPGVQVNVALGGGQQVNVAGS